MIIYQNLCRLPVITKAREADRVHNLSAVGTNCAAKRKLIELVKVRGIVADNFEDMLQNSHSILAYLATSRVRQAGLSRKERPHED